MLFFVWIVFFIFVECAGDCLPTFLGYPLCIAFRFHHFAMKSENYKSAYLFFGCFRRDVRFLSHAGNSLFSLRWCARQASHFPCRLQDLYRHGQSCFSSIGLPPRIRFFNQFPLFEQGLNGRLAILFVPGKGNIPAPCHPVQKFKMSFTPSYTEHILFP